MRSFDENQSVGDFEFVKSVRSKQEQSLLKSLGKSVNAGNANFYDNLHRKYFDRAKARQEYDGFEEMMQGNVGARSPSDEGSLTLSKSRSRSRGVKNRSTKEPKPLGVSQMESDDPNFFDLTAKSNTNTLLGISQLNQTRGESKNGGPKGQGHKRQRSTSARDTKEPYSDKPDNGFTITEPAFDTKSDNDPIDNKFSLNFKNSIYSKINHDPSHALLPSTTSHFQHSQQDDQSLISGFA